MKMKCFILAVSLAGTFTLSASELKDDFENVTKSKSGTDIPYGWIYYEHFNKDGGSLESTEDAKSGKHAMHVKSFDMIDEIFVFNATSIDTNPGDKLEVSFSIKGKGIIKPGLYLYNQKQVYIGTFPGEEMKIDSEKWIDQKIILTVPAEKYNDFDVNKVRILLTLERNTDIFIDDLIVKTQNKEMEKKQ